MQDGGFLIFRIILIIHFIRRSVYMRVHPKATIFKLPANLWITYFFLLFLHIYGSYPIIIIDAKSR